jgi:hypothetical protein
MRYAVTRFCLLLLGCSLSAAAIARAEQIEVLNADGAEIGQSDGNLVDAGDLVNVGFGKHQAACQSCCYPGWYAAGDALFLHRNHARELVIASNDAGTIFNVADDIPLLTTNDLGFNDFETGYRIELGRSLGNGWALEGSFFRINEWDAAAQATSNGAFAAGLSPPLSFAAVTFNADPFYNALQQSVTYTSDLLSAELNAKAAWQCHGLTGAEIFGFRYFRVGEQFSLVSQDTAFSTPTNGFGAYQIRTDNDLFGLQYGQEASLQLHSLVSMQTRLRAGVFVNSAEQRSQVFVNSVLASDIREEEEDVAFVGELNVNFKVKLTRWACARAGYNFLWVEGLALAPEQNFPMALNGFNSLNTHGGLFLHGFNIGVELSR